MSETKEIIKAEQTTPVLTPKVVKDLICKNATEQEIYLFLNICASTGLNPFKREVYLVKYGANPAMTVTGYEVYLKRAEASGKWNGYKCWTEGSLDTKDLVAKCEVYRKDWEKPFYWEVDYTEGLNMTNPITKSKPKHMLKKTCISQALRLAFPDELGGLPYTSDEMGEYTVLNTQPIETNIEEAKTIPPPSAPIGTMPIDITMDKIGGKGKFADKIWIDAPTAYLKSLLEPKYAENIPANKLDAIKRTIEYKETNKSKVEETVSEQATMPPPLFDDKGNVNITANAEPLTVDSEQDKETVILTSIKDTEKTAIFAKDSKRDKEPVSKDIVEFADFILKNTILFTDIEKERILSAVKKLGYNLAIVQTEQLIKVYKQRYDSRYS